ncbi:hypothetical protein IQ63_08980 [Streptomyces acidiscabies]|uniref:Uncharacterized protein n=1 Tax=Streptomyces acidiscabies TaxID=42234 RepID=A0A0L0KHX8_9ACTN|nr:hypothetical protein IQ63_08980 [Streptomyces acidiscabies]
MLRTCGRQNIVLSFAAVSGTSYEASQCSTIFTSRTRKRSITDLPRSPGVLTTRRWAATRSPSPMTGAM